MSFWETLSAVVRTLLIMSVMGSIIALLLFAIKPIINNRLPKNTQHYLWVAALMAFLVPFSAFVTLPFATPMTSVQSIIETNVKSTVEWQNQIAIELYGVPYTQLDDLEQVTVSYREFSARNIGNHNFLLPYVLIFGMTYLLKEIVQYNIYLFKLKRRRLPARENEHKLLPERGPRLFRNSLAATPMLIGLFRPVIYLPDREYSAKQLQNIMLHELTHWRRHDVYIKWAAAISVCLHWFNPIAYFACRELDRVCELACDESVIYNFSADEKQSYGDTLIEMASDAKPNRIIISTTMCEEKKTLKERLGAIMHSKKPTKLVMQASCVLLGIVFCSVIILGGSSHYLNRHFPMTGNKLSDLQPLEITRYIGNVVGKELSELELTSDNFGLTVSADFSFVESEAIRFLYDIDEEKCKAAQLRIFPTEADFFITKPNSNWVAPVEQIFKLYDYLEALKYLPQEKISALCTVPPQRYAIQLSENNRKYNEERQVFYNKDGVMGSSGRNIRLDIQPLYDADGIFTGVGNDIIHAYYNAGENPHR